MKNKSITDIIEETKEKVCNDYCKYRAETEAVFKTEGPDVGLKKWEDMLNEVCEKCPLNRL